MAIKQKITGKAAAGRNVSGAGVRSAVSRAGKLPGRLGLAKPSGGDVERRRFWLTYPTKLITRPVIWEMTRKFDIIFNVRQASVTEEIGILCLEMEAPRERLKKAIRWLEECGVTVEPVEINVIES